MYDVNKITPASLHAAKPELTIVTIGAEKIPEGKGDEHYVNAVITIQDGANVLTLDEGTRYYVDRHDNTKELTFAHRRLFAYVPQGNALMNGTIREVVCFADMANASDDDRLQLALRVACADEFVKGLEKGVDTPLKERGASLSEGQMQRIAIARAIFANSPILLLDESTSALDTDTEKKLLHNLREMTDKTVIIVTHRPAALSICDRVLRFTENGVIET